MSKRDDVAIRTKAIAQHVPEQLLAHLPVSFERACTITRTGGTLPLALFERAYRPGEHVPLVFGCTKSQSSVSEARERCAIALAKRGFTVESELPIKLRCVGVTSFCEYTLSCDEPLFDLVVVAPRLSGLPIERVRDKVMVATVHLTGILESGGTFAMIVLPPVAVCRTQLLFARFNDEVEHAVRCALLGKRVEHVQAVCNQTIPNISGKHNPFEDDIAAGARFASYMLIVART